MTTYYVGPGGNDGNNGQTWANRKLTLNGAEDIPVVADDVVYVAPGVYRETLTVDVSGAGGQPITYIGDVTGEHTDGIGGVVRITGSDDDQTVNRNYAIDDNNTQRNYRTFRGFTFDMTDNHAIRGQAAGTNWIIEDCTFQHSDANNSAIYINDANQASWTIRRCSFRTAHRSGYGIYCIHSATVSNTGHVVSNCIFTGPQSTYAIRIDRIGGITVRNCTFVDTAYGVAVVNALAGGQTTTVNNCIFQAVNNALSATVAGEITENYNTFFGNGNDRVNTNTGASSLPYPALFDLGLLHAGASQASGIPLPQPAFGTLSEWSGVRQWEGSGAATTDFYGLPKPSTDEKRSWGAIQFVDRELEDSTVYAGSYGRVLNDAGQVLVRRIPVTNTQITISMFMRYSTNYEGNLPRMIVKQAGQTDQVDTMVAAADTWEQLSVTFTPAASPGYVEVWAESRHAPTSVDNKQGNISYTTDGTEQTFTDDAQDFSDYDKDPTVADAEADYYMLVFNNDGTKAKGWCRELGASGNTEITISNQQRLNDNGTQLPAMWIGKYAAKTPYWYGVYETAWTYFDEVDVE